MAVGAALNEISSEPQSLKPLPDAGTGVAGAAGVVAVVQMH